MPNTTCLDQECTQPAQRREWCNVHYRRLLKAGKLTPRTGTCRDCGDVFTAGKTARIPTRCGTCSTGRGTCVTCGVEVDRTIRRNGSIAPARKYCTDECKPHCVVNGCSAPRRKREWCANHYAIWFARGDAEAPLKYTWATERRCLTCGTSDPQHWTALSRKFCSPTCSTTWKKYKGEIPVSFNCAICGINIEYFDPVSRKRLRSDAAYCAAHVRHARVYVTVEEIAAEDGIDCRLCGEPVDLSIPSPNRLSPSIDHITPRALGGSDERENLQLAHRGCNSSKRHFYVA